MKKILVPIMDRLVVRPDKEEEQSKGGIHLPDEAKKKPRSGVVLWVGRGRYLENGQVTRMEIEPGHHVYYTEFAGHKVKLDGEELLVMNEADVLAIEGVEK